MPQRNNKFFIWQNFTSNIWAASGNIILHAKGEFLFKADFSGQAIFPDFWLSKGGVKSE